MIQSKGNNLDFGTLINAAGTLHLSPDHRSTHLHVVGSTGSGKSKFLEHLIRQDIMANKRSGCGVLVIDPHGSLYDSLVSWMAFNQLDRDLVPIDLRRNDWIVAYNLLRARPKADPAVVVDSIVDAVAHVWGASNTDATPRLARWLGNIARVLYEKQYTLAEAVHLIGEPSVLRTAMITGIGDAMTRQDWQRADSMSERDFETEVSSSVNRLRRFLGSDRLQLMFGQTGASLDLGDVLESGKIVLVSLARRGGHISKENADLVATLLLGDLWLAAQQRGKGDRITPFYVYVDEFQRFLTPTIAENLDEARGFGLHLTFAHQFPNQLRNAGDTGLRVFDSVMENARSKAVFSLSTLDNLKPMAEWLFTGVLDPDQLKHVLSSTKVMDYVEEIQRTTGSSTTSSTGGTRHSSTSTTEGTGHSEHAQDFLLDPELREETRSTSQSAGSSEGSTHSHSESRTESESTSTFLRPVMGKEVSSVQFRSVEEQLFQMMGTLFDQEQRRCIVRLRGMRAPVTVTVPTITEKHLPLPKVDEYVARQLARLPFAISLADARVQLDKRTAALSGMSFPRILEGDVLEPTTVRRRIRRKP